MRVDRVDDVGVHLQPGEDTVVDVLFDGRRIWSFWTVRDTTDGVATWPPQESTGFRGSSGWMTNAKIRPTHAHA